jgi:hypothetical protein
VALHLGIDLARPLVCLVFKSTTTLHKAAIDVEVYNGALV